MRLLVSVLSDALFGFLVAAIVGGQIESTAAQDGLALLGLLAGGLYGFLRGRPRRAVGH